MFRRKDQIYFMKDCENNLAKNKSQKWAVHGLGVAVYGIQGLPICRATTFAVYK